VGGRAAFVAARLTVVPVAPDLSAVGSGGEAVGRSGGAPALLRGDRLALDFAGVAVTAGAAEGCAALVDDCAGDRAAGLPVLRAGFGLMSVH
jgi:hypothetical protein